MPRFADALQQQWYRAHPSWAILLLPLHLLFVLISSVRRWAYQRGWLASVHPQIPVIVVGNLTVGGAGKTPLTLALTTQLQQLGYTPAIISRGYGSHAKHPTIVSPDSDPALCGDEPVLLASRTQCPVVVCRDRVKAAAALRQHAPNVNVIIADDGLQHYRLARDIEIAVFDGTRGLGNGWRLPIGPLREPPQRLKYVDAVVFNGIPLAEFPCFDAPRFVMTLTPGAFYRVHSPHITADAATLQQQLAPTHTSCAAVAGIAHPQRFFNTLNTLGFHCAEYPYPDHHTYTAQDLPTQHTVFVTEKDAVKLRHDKLGSSATLWALPVSAQLPPEFTQWLHLTLQRHVQPVSPPSLG